MKIKTADLTGAALDWAVAECRGFDGLDEDLWLMRDGLADMPLHAYTPSTDWAQGGPIIEREGITLRSCIDGAAWDAELAYEETILASGPTPLIAAMRCYCYAELGEYVDIPEKLLP